MRKKLGPWLPAIFCAILSAITVIGNLIAYQITGNANAVSMVFHCFLPMCFFFVGAFLLQLQNENRELRSQIDTLTSARHGEKNVAQRTV